MDKRADVRSMDVVLTAGCNLSCSYCYENDKQPARRMDWKTLRGSIDLLLGSRSDEVSLCFYGGEPLLRFDMIRRAVAYAERECPGDKRLRYSIITNGTLIRDKHADFLAAHRFETQLSCDGVRPAQAQRGAGTFEVVDRMLDRVRKRHPAWFAADLYVIVTLLPFTIDYLADSFEYLAGKGLRRICFSPQFTDSSAWRVDRIDDLDRQVARVFEYCLRHYEETGHVLLDFFRKVDDDVHAPVGTSMCGVDSGQALSVDADGQVYGCVTFAESFQQFGSEFMREQLDPLKIGPLDADSFEDRLRGYPAAAAGSAMFHDKPGKYSSYGRCGECAHIETCGICPVSIGNIPGNRDPRRIPDFLCAYNLILHKYRALFPRQENPFDILHGDAMIPRQMQQLRTFLEARK